MVLDRFAGHNQACWRRIHRFGPLDGHFGPFGMNPGRGGTIRLSGLSIGYGRTPVLDGLTGSFGSGSLTALVGPNGAGKSTLLMTLAGLLKPLEGTLTIDGNERRGIAYLPQNAAIDREFPITVFDLVAAGLFQSIGSFRAPDEGAKRQIHAALEKVDLTLASTTMIGHLSGGQLQRALFARLIVQDAPTILMDEPFSAIDTATVDILLDLILQWNRQGRTIIASLHDLDLVQRCFPETFRIGKTSCNWGPTPNFQIASSPIHENHQTDESA